MIELLYDIRDSWRNQPDENMVKIWNAYCDATRNDRTISENDPDDLFRGMTPSDIIDALEDGHYSSSETWVQNRFGEFWSFDDLADSDINDFDESELITWVIENKHYDEETHEIKL